MDNQKEGSTLRQLHASIERLYSVFSGYSKPTLMQGDFYDITDSQETGILSKPLRELSFPELKFYYTDAILICGTADDYRYFLPRLYEIMALTPDWPGEWELSFGMLKHVEFYEWPEVERASIVEFAMTLWDHKLSQFQTGDACYGDFIIDSILTGLGQFVEDLSPFLDVLGETTTSIRACNYANMMLAFLVQWGMRDDDDGLIFWGEREKQFLQVAEWYIKGDSKRHLLQIATDYPELQKEVDLIGLCRQLDERLRLLEQFAGHVAEQIK